MKIKKRIKYNISFIIISLWLILIATGLTIYFQYNLSIEGMFFGSKNFFNENVLIGIILFAILYAVRPLFFISGSIFDVYAGMVYGTFLGFIVCSLGVFLATIFGYFVGKYTGGIFVSKKSIENPKGIYKSLRKNTFKSAIFARLIFLPFDLVNYLAGVLQVRFREYLAGSTIGSLPATLIFVGAGGSFYGQNIDSFEALIQNVDIGYLVLSSGLLITIYTFALFLKKKYQRIYI